MNTWHPGSRELLQRICEAVGVRFPREVEKPIYQNAHCSKAQIYKAYVKEALIPAMEVMENDPLIATACWKDSNYYKLKDNNQEFAKRVKQFLGTDFCPMHTFLLERLFSVWIHGKGLNIITV